MRNLTRPCLTGLSCRYASAASVVCPRASDVDAHAPSYACMHSPCMCTCISDATSTGLVTEAGSPPLPLQCSLIRFVSDTPFVCSSGGAPVRFLPGRTGTGMAGVLLGYLAEDTGVPLTDIAVDVEVSRVGGDAVSHPFPLVDTLSDHASSYPVATEGSGTV